ncbi:MAG: translation initiation factor IF-2 [Gammaproteobacteria bacterium]|nr:translation initiation factor IF-2 [Gammaproteobacteria bacterium]
MAEVTVKQLAGVIGIPVDKLLEQLGDAGVDKSGEADAVSDEEKRKLLLHLRSQRGQPAAEEVAARPSISLRRKRTSEVKTDASGRKTVNVEVRTKRRILRADETAAPETEEEEVPLAADSADEVGAVSESLEPTPVVEELDAGEQAARQALAEAEAAAADAVSAEVDRVAREAAEAATRQADAPTESAEPPTAPAEPTEPSELEALKQAQRQWAEEQARAAAERQAERQATQTRLKETEELNKRESELREQQRKAAEEAQKRAAIEAQQQAAGAPDRAGGKPSKGRKGKGGGSDSDTRYGRNQLHVSKGKSGKRKGKQARRPAAVNIEAKHGFEKPTAPVVRDVEVPDTITVADLANKMAVKAAEVIKAMMGMGVMATINQMLDQDTAILVVEEMGHNATAMSEDDMEARLAQKIVDALESEAVARPPVVTVMGHVDHGKTSLLDYIRKARIAAGEAGGITQHIGAYQTETDNGVITFLDTPGHAAFTAMRARGAQATDIVVLVVAADDGVMPQSIEGVQHAKAAGVPLVVAVNKIDKEDADPERVKNELSQHDVIPEDWGGDVQFMPVSAITGEGVPELLDAISLQAEVLELKAPELGNATGSVIEAALDKGRGPVATVLVQTGTLRRGDIILCGSETGRVRAMFDENGQQTEEAGPSTPVQILGLSGTPNAGDEMLVASDEKSARELAEVREGKHRDARLAERKPTKLDDVFSQIQTGAVPSLNLLVKADVKGSFEAIRDSLEKLSTDEVTIRVVGGGVGGINESDANLAAASNAILVGFNVRADNTARRLIQEHDIDLRYYSVIYELIDLVKQVAGGMLPPEVKERIIGTAEVRDVFKSPKFGLIAGSMVIEGVVKRDAPIRVLRDNVVIFEGELESLRRFKDDVKEVNSGTECGIGVKNYTDVRPMDNIEVFERTEVARTL